MVRHFYWMALAGLLSACTLGGGDGDDGGDGGSEAPLSDSEQTCTPETPLVTCEDVVEEEPEEEEEPEPETEQGVPESLAVNLTAFEFSNGGETLRMELRAIDSTPVEALYTRYPALDLPGYRAFIIQEDPLDRFFVALGNVSADGSVGAVAVGSGELFDRIMQGSGYERTGDYTPPEVGEGPGAGQVSYAGTYAGISNFVSGNGEDLLDSSGADPEIRPSQPGLVTGLIFINANFADNLVEGRIYDREAINPNPNAVADGERVTIPLADVNMELTTIDETGEFFGQVFTREQGVDEFIGNYGGIFGGDGAAYVAGSVRIEVVADDYEEVGVFVLTQCGLPGDDAATCALTQPEF